MEIILLEKINKLGDPGDLVIVKPGYARNFLIPTGKAIRANEENKAEYEERKLSLEKAELERKSTALELADKLKSLKISIPVPVSEEGTLYGSIGTREISDAIKYSFCDIFRDLARSIEKKQTFAKITLIRRFQKIKKLGDEFEKSCS